MYNELTADSIIKSASDELTLIDKFLGDDLTIQLSSLLSTNDSIRRITLRGSNITHLGAQAIANMLENNMFLESLSLEWNQIGDAGAVAIAAALTKNKQLKSLDLKNNQISDKGCLALADTLRLNRSLKSLDLRWNQIGDNGVNPYHEILARESFPVIVELSGNLITSTMMATLENGNGSSGIVSSSSSTATATATGIENFNETIFNTNKSHLHGQDQADKISSKRKSVLLENNINELREDLEITKQQKEEIQLQLNQSAIKIVELEQQIKRDAFTYKQADNELDSMRKKYTELQDEKNLLESVWEKEREGSELQFNTKLREKEVEVRSLTTERNGLLSRVKTAEEETKHISSSKSKAAEIHEQQKADLLQELRENMDKLTTLSADKNSLEHNNNYLSDLNDRSKERIASLQEELTKFRNEASSKLNEEILRAENEISRINTEHKNELNDLRELSNRQAKSIGELSTEVSQLQASQASAAVEYRLNMDIAVNEAKDVQQKLYEGTITDLRSKVDTFMQFKSELEERNNNYLKENEELKVRTTNEMNSIQDQLKYIKIENERLQTDLNETKDSSSKYQSKSENLAIELYDVKEKYEETSAETSKWKRISEDMINKNHKLTTEVATLKKELKDAVDARGSDFNMVSTRISDALRKEFEMLAVTLQKD